MDNKQTELIVTLQSGDPEAFDVLVHSFRDKAEGWAKRIVQDPHLAEDVVQEAFMQLRGKIGGLKDPGKFTAWFRQMVIRIALNHIRGYSKGEVPVERIQEPSQPGRVMCPTEEPLQQALLREYELELLHLTIDPLPEQARQLMASYIQEEATPEELAARFDMKKSNVYNIISRSRAKAADERFEREIERHLAARKLHGSRAFLQLQTPAYNRPYALISILMAEVLRITGEPNWTLTEVMAISGDAFRLNVARDCSWKGLSTFEWSYAAYRTLERIGFSGTCYGRPSRTSITPDQQIAILTMIQESIDRGLPVIVWNLDINEFGFVYGYSDIERTITYMGYDRKPKTFRYAQLGRTGEEPAIFILAMKQRVSSPASEDEILASIIRHARGQEPPVSGFGFGLAGYGLWIEAIEKERLDLHGHAYQVAILSEARHHGALYLNSLSDHAKDSNRKRLLSEAAACYRISGEAFARMYPSFPFGYGGSHANQLSVFREGLLTACEAERKAISLLNKIIKES